MSALATRASATPAMDRAMPKGAPRAWEVTLLRRATPRHQPLVAGRLLFDADDAATARRIAEDGLASRADGDHHWALGPLRPLTRSTPGTYPYRVTFAMWHERVDGFVRQDVLVTTLWATDAQSARRLATTEAQASPAHEGAWRVREVRRVGHPSHPSPSTDSG